MQSWSKKVKEWTALSRSGLLGCRCSIDSWKLELHYDEVGNS